MLKFFLKKLNQITVGNFRAKILSQIIAKIILKHSKKRGTIKIIDYGSGYQPKVIFYIYDILKNKHKLNTKIFCYDIYDIKYLKNLNQNKDIVFLRVKNLKFDYTKYDFCLVNDVLHHIGVEKILELKKLIIRLQNKARFVLIKDHFQYSFFSNLTLRIMDFLGNYFNDVSTPSKYFSISSFTYLLKLSNSKIVEKILNIRLYQYYFLFMSNPKLHFIYLIKKYNKN